MKVIIVGRVAEGVSCAARLRRLDEKAEILMVNVDLKFLMQTAVCFLMWGGVIEEESGLV